MNKSKAGIDIIQQLNKENKILLESFKNQEDEFKKLEKTIINQKNILEKSELEKKVGSLRKEISLYNKDKILKLKALEQKKTVAQSQLIDLINIIMIDFMDKNSISLILKKETLFVGKKELDITNKILLAIDNKIKKIDIK
jgi:Skp family chaperone for outer membrane proteins